MTETVDDRQWHFSMYVSKDLQPYFERVRDLSEKINVSVSRVLLVCGAACIDTLEKNAKSKRSFKLNGKTVVL